MRVTQEADYAIRICCVLDDARSRLGASEIAERAGITQKFALKILRKLSLAKIVRSFAGNKGGYELNRDANDLTIAEILELIEGAISLSKCMDCVDDCNCGGCAHGVAIYMATQDKYRNEKNAGY